MHREKSEQFHRQKLSLKHLLNIDLESQYRSTNLNQRPKTMYTQRQLKIFQEERKQLTTDYKAVRGISQQISRTRYQSLQNTSEDRVLKQKLKQSLGKIMLLAEGKIQLEAQDKIRSIYLFLESLSRQIFSHEGIGSPIQVQVQTFRTENFYKAAFGYIYESFNDIVYINNIEWSREHLQIIASNTQCQMLIKLYNGVKDISYKQLSNELFKALDKQIIHSEQYRAKVEENFASLEGKLAEKNHVIQKLTQEVHFYENHPSKQQYGYISELEVKVASLEKQLRQAQLHIRQLENSEQYLNQYTGMLSQKVEELRAKLYEFQIEQFSSLKEVEKNSELKQFQQNVIVLKDLIHKGALRMSSMREEYNKLQAYNHQLIGERSVLAKRAAVGFASLTPRPNYQQIFKDNDINIDQLLPDNTKPSTQQLVSCLIKGFKNVYHKYVQSQPRIQFEQRNNYQKHKDPAKLILKELQQAQKQLHLVEGLSEDVHKGYKKQKEEKDHLKNKRK